MSSQRLLFYLQSSLIIYIVGVFLPDDLEVLLSYRVSILVLHISKFSAKIMIYPLISKSIENNQFEFFLSFVGYYRSSGVVVSDLNFALFAKFTKLFYLCMQNTEA